MKKLIAILVVFAMVMGAAFAEANIGGQVQMGATLLNGNSDADDVMWGGVGIGGNNNHVNVRFGDDTSGGMTRLYSAKNPDLPGHFDLFSFVWWRPAEVFRIQMGRNPDGDWGAAQIVDWGFTAEAKNGVAAVNDYGGGLYMAERSSAFFGGMSAMGINLSFYPTDAVTINIGLPMNAKDTVSNLDLQTQLLSDIILNLVFGIEDIGTLRVSFIGKEGLAKDAADEASPGEAYLNFHLTAIEGAGMEFGFKVGIPGKDQDAPINIGYGLNLGGDSFGFKLRAGAGINGDVTTISAGLLPSFPLSGLTLFIHAGLGVKIDSADDTNVIDWFLNPYIEVPAGNLKFYTGLQIFQNGVTDGGEDQPVNYALLIGFNAYF